MITFLNTQPNRIALLSRCICQLLLPGQEDAKCIMTLYQFLISSSIPLHPASFYASIELRRDCSEAKKTRSRMPRRSSSMARTEPGK